VSFVHSNVQNGGSTCRFCIHGSDMRVEMCDSVPLTGSGDRVCSRDPDVKSRGQVLWRVDSASKGGDRGVEGGVGGPR